MKIKLIDHIIPLVEGDIPGTYRVDFPEYKFQADDGSGPYWVEGWEIDQGTPLSVYIASPERFAAWLSRIEFKTGTIIDYDLLYELEYAYLSYIHSLDTLDCLEQVVRYEEHD